MHSVHGMPPLALSPSLGASSKGGWLSAGRLVEAVGMHQCSRGSWEPRSQRHNGGSTSSPAWHSQTTHSQPAPTHSNTGTEGTSCRLQ